MNNEISLGLAKQLLVSIQKLDAVIGELDSLYSECDQLSVSETKVELKENIGQLMAISFELVGPIVRQHNDLDPDRN